MKNQKLSYWITTGVLTTGDDVILAISKFYNINPEQILGNARYRNIAEARHLSSYFLYEKLRKTTPGEPIAVFRKVGEM